MRRVPQILTDTWLSGEFTGSRRPMARVTIQRLHVNLQKVDQDRLFASALFGQADIPWELPNVKSVEWDRSVGTDAATCTIVFYNTTPLPLGDQPTPAGDFDLPGYYTYNYGATSWSSSHWGTTANKWQDYLMPDRLLRTYEGYGFTTGVAPEKDPHLVQTGVWMIDDIEFSTEGLITVTCRDVGRLLIDHIMFPPVIPLHYYPMDWEWEHDVDNPDVTTSVGGEWRPTYSDDSGKPYWGRNALNHGHKPSDALDALDATYWLSVGNALPNAGYSFEWIEGKCSGKTVSTVTFKTYGGPYRAYLSLKVGGKWQGNHIIPYDPKNPISAPNGADIPYSYAMTAGRETTSIFTLPAPLAKVDAVRITLTGLYNSGIGPYRYRAGIRDIVCSSQHQVTKDGGTHTQGNYRDYTDIVKYLLACGGFHWPRTANAYLTNSDGSKTPMAPPDDSWILKSGRIWGDLEDSGTHAYFDSTTGTVVKLGPEIWDKKPLMDGIAYIRDILGFVFFIDETGGAVFRLPNIFTVGNWIGDLAKDAGYSPVDQTPLMVIDERQTLIGLRSKISSKNIREYVFVANTNGAYGAVSAGFNPLLQAKGPNPGLRRVGGWTDQNFRDAAEARKMADLITITQAFTWRSNSVTIVANPAIQIDDQIRIYERQSNDGYIHYVKGVKSTNNLEDGKWTYDLTTNWLGEDTLVSWAFDQTALDTATREFLDAVLAARTALATNSGGAWIEGGGTITTAGRKL